MRESVMDVLFYLFDDLLDEESDAPEDVELLSGQLSEAGFHREQIQKALNWFQGLSILDTISAPQNRAPYLRVFNARERMFLSEQCLDYLRGLLRRGLVYPEMLEVIIERALAIGEPIEFEDLRWIVAMVALNVDPPHGVDLSEITDPFREPTRH